MIIGAAQAPTFNGVPHTAETKQWLAAVLLGVSLRAGQFDKAEPLWNRTTKAEINRAFPMVGLTDALSVLRSKSLAQAFKIPIGDLEKALGAVSTLADLNKARLELKRQRAKLPKTADFGWFDSWETRLNVLAAYLADKPATIDFTPNLVSYLTNNEWEFVDKNSVRAHGVYQLELPLPQAYGPYEVSFGLTIKKPTKEPKMLLGVLMGTERQGSPMFGRPFGISCEGVAYVRTSSGTMREMAKVVQENKIRVRVWESFAEFYVNDELVFCNQCFDFEPNGRVQLISPMEKGEKYSDIVYHHIQVGRLSETVPPHEIPERVKYFTAQLKKKDDTRMRRWRGTDYLLLGKFQEAAEDFSAHLANDEKDYFARQIGARALHNVEDYEQELKVLQELVKLTPLSAYANCELAWFLATCPDDKISDHIAAQKQIDLTEEMYEGKEKMAQFALVALAIEKKDYKKAEAILKVYGKYLEKGTEEIRYKLLREAIDQQSVVRDKSKVRDAHYTVDWDTEGRNNMLKKKP
jgi:tetratricopeptide (TPR) repeat protein